jgi:hypothetical protein
MYACYILKQTGICSLSPANARLAALCVRLLFDRPCFAIPDGTKAKQSKACLIKNNLRL